MLLWIMTSHCVLDIVKEKPLVGGSKYKLVNMDVIWVEFPLLEYKYGRELKWCTKFIVDNCAHVFEYRCNSFYESIIRILWHLLVIVMRMTTWFWYTSTCQMAHCEIIFMVRFGLVRGFIQRDLHFPLVLDVLWSSLLRS